MIELSKKQAEAIKIANILPQYSNGIDNQLEIVLYGGAIRGGKTRWLITSIILYLLVYPKSRGVIIRKDYPTISKNLWPSISDFLSTTGFDSYLLKRNLSSYMLEFINGSVLMLMSEAYDTDKELNRFKGLEVNIIGIDEINEIQEETFQKCIERAGTWFKSKSPIRILATCNPTQNWVKNLFYDRWKTNTLPNKWTYIPAKITDNPFRPDGFVASLKESLNPILFERFVNGDWEVTDTAFFDTTQITILSPQEFDRITFGKTIDYYFDGAYTDKKYNDPSAILACCEVNNNLYIYNCEAKHIESSELSNYIQNFVKSNRYTPNSVIYVEPYASGQTVVGMLRRESNLNVIEYQFPKESKITYGQSKITRALSIVNFVGSKRIFLRSGAWNKPYIQELQNFPTGKNDDQVDITTMASSKVIYKKDYSGFLGR